MKCIKLGSILFEEKKTVGSANGNNLELIGVSNTTGLYFSKTAKIDNLRRYKLIQKGWFAYNPMRINVGSIGYAFNSSHIGIVSPDYIVFSVSDKIIPEYLLFILKSEGGIESINKNASGAVRKRLYFSNLSDIEINLPSIETQKESIKLFKRTLKIVENISSHNSKQSLISQFKTAIINEAVLGELSESSCNENNTTLLNELSKILNKDKKTLIKEHQSISEINTPSHWVKLKFKTVLDMKGGSQPPKSKFSSEPRKDHVRLFQIRDFGDKPIPVFVPVESVSKFCNSTDIMIGRYGASIGKVFIGKDGAYNVALIKLFWNESIFIQKYLFYLFQSSHIQSFFENCSRSAQAGFNKKDIGELIIPIPPISEQHQIVSIIEKILDKGVDLENEIKRSEHHAQLLMQSMLREAFESKNEMKLETVN